MHLYPDSSGISLNVGQKRHVRHMVGYGYVDLKNWTFYYQTANLDIWGRGDNLGDRGTSGTRGVCPTNRTWRSKVDIWASIWPNPYPDGKVHKSVVRLVSVVVDQNVTMDTIWDLVSGCGITDEMDILATSRAIWTFRDRCRNAAKA